MKIQNISINNINKTKIDSQFSKTTTNHSNYQITSLTNLYYPVTFKAKEEKNIPSAEEIAKRKALEFAAIAQRKNMPKFLQMLYPLPVSSGIKAKHVNEINKYIISDDKFSAYPKLKKMVESFISGKYLDEFIKKEEDALNTILYTTNDNTVMLEDAPYTELLNKAFSTAIELEDLSIKEKAFITSILKLKGIDGGELSKAVVNDYKNLIQYAKDNKDKLTEPVEAILSDNQIDTYFENNKAKSIIALLTAGGHPSRQRLEHRLNKYDKTLDTINYLFHIPELRKDLITICENQNKVNPAEIIKFFELSKGFLDLGITNDELKNLINKSILPEGINIDYLSTEYLKTLNKTLNTNIEEIDTEKWDLSNVYTIPYFLKLDLPEHKDRFKDLFIATLNNSYDKLIHNPEKEYGLSNIKTAKLFENNGLNYKKWLNYNKENSFTLLTKTEYENRKTNIPIEAKFPKNNEDFSVRVWKRNPERDLFQGSTAGQCIALDGVNGFAGVDELLYTYAQLIEVVNKSKNKSVGNACVYWIKDTNNQKSLLIDSIGIHTEYENNPQIRKEIFEYVKEYAKDIADEPVKIYIGNQFNKLDISDLSEPQIGIFKIIGNTNKLKSYLDAIIAKDRFERYTVIDERKDYIMELREVK